MTSEELIHYDYAGNGSHEYPSADQPILDLRDRSGNGIHLTEEGNLANTTDTRWGVAATGFKKEAFAQRDETSPYSLSQNLTVSFVYRFNEGQDDASPFVLDIAGGDSTQGIQTYAALVVDDSNTGTEGSDVAFHATDCSDNDFGGNTGQMQGNTFDNIPDGIQHITFRAERVNGSQTELSFFHNGSQEGRATRATLLCPDPGHREALTVGTDIRQGNGNQLQSHLYDLRIFNKALTDQQIAALAEGHGSSEEGTEQAWYTFGDPVPGYNQPPEATLSFSCERLRCVFDGSASTDPDGSLTSFHWSFGDGETAAGETVEHTYDATGTYEVSLTVTDNDGVNNTTSDQVSLSDPPPLLEGGFLTPTSGTGDTVYTFGVTYRDNGEAAAVHARIDGEQYAMSKADTNDTDPTDGILYTMSTRLSPGLHEYQFLASDGDNQTTTPLRQGPEVEPQAYFADDVETGPGGWTASAGSLWHRATLGESSYPNPFSGGASWWFGDEDDGDFFADGGSGTLTSPPIDLTTADSSASLSFVSWQDASFADGRTVEVSVDGGPWEEVERVNDTRDDNKWFPRIVDLSAYVGHEIRVRFNFQAGLIEGGRGWYIDDIAVGIDSDRDRITNWMEQLGTLIRTRFATEDNVTIQDGRTVNSTLHGLDHLNTASALLSFTLDHPDWDGLSVSLWPGDEGSCQVPLPDGFSGRHTITRDLFDDVGCRVDPASFENHQPWRLFVTDHDTGNEGRIESFQLVLDGTQDAFDADMDRDRRLDGDEWDPPDGLLSHPLSRDVDDDNILDPNDKRPFVEDVAPKIRDLRGFDDPLPGRDFQDGIEFRVADNRGSENLSTEVRAWDLDGSEVLVQLIDEGEGAYIAKWDAGPLNSVANFTVNVTDPNDNWFELEGDLRGEDGGVENQLNEIGAKSGRAGPAAAGIAVLAIPAEVPVLIVIGVAAAAALAYQFVGQAVNGEDVSARLAAVSPTELASGSAAGVDLSVHQGNALRGWGRIVDEHPELVGDGALWPSATAFVEWLEGQPPPEIEAIKTVDEIVEIVVLEADKIVTALVVGGAVADVDVFPTEISLWGQDRLSIEQILKLYLLMAESAFGEDHLNDLPPAFIAPIEEEHKEQRRLDTFTIKSVNANESGQQRREIRGFAFDSQFIDAVMRLVEQNNQIQEDAMNAAVAQLSLDAVRKEAREFDEAQAPWYWGSDQPQFCPSTGIERRRCDKLPLSADSFTPLGSNETLFERIATTWLETNTTDALSVAAASNFLTENTPICIGVEDALGEAEERMRQQTGTFDARIPVSVNMVSGKILNIECHTRTVVLELAETNSDFKYSS